MENRKLKVSENRDGHGSTNYKLALPKKWIDEMFKSHEGVKFVNLEFDNDTIKIKKN